MIPFKTPKVKIPCRSSQGLSGDFMLPEYMVKLSCAIFNLYFAQYHHSATIRHRSLSGDFPTCKVSQISLHLHLSHFYPCINLWISSFVGREEMAPFPVVVSAPLAFKEPIAFSLSEVPVPFPIFTQRYKGQTRVGLLCSYNLICLHSCFLKLLQQEIPKSI